MLSLRHLQIFIDSKHYGRDQGDMAQTRKVFSLIAEKRHTQNAN